MFFVVFGIVGLSYGPYVLWPVVWPTHTLLSWLCISIFHVLIALLLGSYVACVFTDPGSVPLGWSRMIEADEKLSSEHRYCTRTRLYRPLRSHFCSITRRVVLNMDHFCPWVINTVGFYNRKFFVLFLIYTAASCCWVVLTSLPLLLELREPGAMRALERRIGPSKFMFCSMAVILDFALIVMLSCFMPFHVRMVMLNETTIEGPSPEFHAGVLRNWRQVMGKERWAWFLPIWAGGPDGDGVHWPSPMVKWANDAQADGYGTEDAASSSEGVRRATGAHALEEGRLLASRCEDSSDGE